MAGIRKHVFEIGQQIHFLTVLEYLGAGYWKCVCRCGKETNPCGARLASGETRSCGCYSAERTRQSSAALRYMKNPIDIEGDTASIRLSGNSTTMIDLQDLQKVTAVGVTWFKDGSGYARAHTRRRDEDGKYRVTVTQLHRVITGAGPGEIVDHIDGNKLDNRKHNLRITSQSVNGKNRHDPPRARSGFMGVHPTRSGRWRAELKVDYRPCHLGVFDTPEEASCAVEAARVEAISTSLKVDTACRTCLRRVMAPHHIAAEPRPQQPAEARAVEAQSAGGRA